MNRLLHLAVLLAISPALAQADARALEAVDDFGSNPGGLRMWRHVPAGLPAPTALVVLLHGCGQTASDYDDEVGWLQLAERWRFALLLPEQQAGNNPSLCFRWFEAGQTARDQGEALSIRQMVARMEADLPIDPARVYVSGLSSGGAMALVMLAAYPEAFAAGGAVAGLPYRCATSLWGATACMQGARDLLPEEWAELVRGGSGLGGPWPRLAVWAGEADRTVAPENAREIVEQWTALLGLDPDAAEESALGAHRRRRWRDGAGQIVLEAVDLAFADHGQPVQPGADPPCGQPGPYRLELGVCAAQELGRFFGLEPSGEDGGEEDGGEVEDAVDGEDSGAEADDASGEDAGDDPGGTDSGDGGDTGAELGLGCGCASGAQGGSWALLTSALATIALAWRRRVPGV